MNRQELPAEKLRFTCPEDLFEFETTENVPPLKVMIGQERAVKAVEFGLHSPNPGYNIFMSGLVGTGKMTYARAAVKRMAGTRSRPNDLCYVNNFENPSQPTVLSLPAGQGTRLHEDMQELVIELKTDIPKVFASDDYEKAKSDLFKELQAKRGLMVESFNQMAQENGVLPQWSSTGFAGVPVGEDGKPLAPDEYQKLAKEDREAIDKKLLAVHEKAMEIVQRMQHLEREMREQLKKLDAKVALYVVGHFIEELKEQYIEYPQVVEYLEDVKQDIVKNINEFKPLEEEPNPLAMFQKNMRGAVKGRYNVNVLVDNGASEGAPVVVENNPTYYNLVGRVEYETRMGVVSTDYTMIKPGAIHKANGGYLILNARDLLVNIGSWEALKRVLKAKKLFMENLGEQYGMLAMASLKPEPLPVDIKVILVGNPQIYFLLYNQDEDFQKLFKIHADFDVEMDNNEENIKKLVGFISSTVERENLKHFDRSAVVKVVEYCSRLAENQKKLTTRFNEVVEILCEADVWAELDGSKTVHGAHITKAIAEKRYRSNKYEERLQEFFAQGKLLIDTDEKKIGQVNGLAVLAVGEHAFGKPSRITANTFMGKGGVVNIERETKMSGSSHSKGVLTLGGYLGEKYAQRRPLTLSASLTFEQLYDGVDGDSASSTELYAILSSLAELPVKQYIAVTGSVNQKGEIQPIGGVNQKIEGFFTFCQIKGLTGWQGVMIPWQNADDLTLNDEVVAAVREGQFHIYPVKTIDEGIEILTDTAAGERRPDGTYPSATVHGLASRKLQDFIETMLKLSKDAEEAGKIEGRR